MPILKNRRLLAAKLETTSGVAATLASGTDAMIGAYDVQIDVDIAYNERVSSGAFGRLAGVSGTRAGTLRFKLEAAGSGTAGTAPAYATVLLEACAMAVSSGVFTPVSAASAQKSATIEVFEDGIVKKLVGAMGTWTLNLEDGKIPYFDFDFKGVWQAPTDAAMFTPQFATVLPAHFQGATLTVGGYTPTASKVTLAMGNVVSMREDVTNAAGYIAAIITDRKVTGSLDPEATTIATYDAYGLFLAGTTAVLTCTFGSSGTGLSVACPDLQYTGIKEGDRNGKVIHNLDFIAAQNGSTVDAEVTITY